MQDEQRQELIRLLQQGEDISPEWARILFPPEKREYELVYYGKEREEDILANTLAVPRQPVRTFGKNGEDWHNMLVTDGVSLIQTNKNHSAYWPYCRGHALPPHWLKACNPARNGGVDDHHHRVYHGVVF